MLAGSTILIVEDEALVALDLADEVEAAKAVVVGPAASIAEAFSLIEASSVTAAILDANLADRDVTPLALHLIAMAVPFVVHTGNGLPDALMAAHPEIIVIMKPAASRIVIGALEKMMARGA